MAYFDVLEVLVGLLGQHTSRIADQYQQRRYKGDGFHSHFVRGLAVDSHLLQYEISVVSQLRMILSVIGVYPREPVMLLGLHLPALRDQVEVINV